MKVYAAEKDFLNVSYLLAKIVEVEGLCTYRVHFMNSKKILSAQSLSIQRLAYSRNPEVILDIGECVVGKEMILV